jgi:hypothetical protein
VYFFVSGDNRRQASSLETPLGYKKLPRVTIVLLYSASALKNNTSSLELKSILTAQGATRM